MMKKFLENKRKSFFTVFAAVILVLGFWAGGAWEAEATDYEFLHIKLDTTGGDRDGSCGAIENCTQLWQVHGFNGLPHDGLQSATAPGAYKCPIWLVQEWTGLTDVGAVLWAEAGLNNKLSKSGTSISSDLTNETLADCSLITTSGVNCNLGDSQDVANFTYGLVDERGDAQDITLSNAVATTYRPDIDILCAGANLWKTCESDSCTTIGSDNWACKSNTWTKCTATETCVAGACVAAACGTNPQVTANPTSQSASAGDTKTYTITIKNNDEAGCSNRTFNLTASGPSGWTTISLDKASTSSLSPGSSDTATLTVKSKNPESDGIYVISVIAEDSADSAKKSSVSVDYVIGALVCPVNYKAEFTSSKIANEDNYILNIKVNDNETGEICVYRYPISGVSRDMGINPSTFGIPLLPITGCSGITGNLTCSNYDTGENTGGYGLGTYRVTINPNSTSCNYNSPCFDTVEVVDCIDNSDCTAPATCVGDTCVVAGCTADGGACAVNGDCCSGNCSGGTCQAACVPTGPEDCAVAGDEDCTNGADCADPACPDGTICGGTNFCDGGNCVECTATDLTNCEATEVCSAGTCIPCTEDGFAAADASLCCVGLNYIDGECTSKCDPKAWFFCNSLRGTVEDISQAGETMIGYVLGLIGSVALLLIIIAGVMYMTSMGNEEKITTSKRILTGAVIGLAIALLSYSLLELVISIL